jgi:hypothetical protein
MKSLEEHGIARLERREHRWGPGFGLEAFAIKDQPALQADLEYVRMYLSQKKEGLKERQNEIGNKRVETNTCYALLVIGIAGCLVSVCILVNRSEHFQQRGQSLPTSTVEWISTIIFASTLVLLAAWAFFKRDNKRTARYRKNEIKKTNHEFNSDPINARAILIMDAVVGFNAHHEHYSAWFDAVQDGQIEANEQEADRHFEFVQRAFMVIRASAMNFARTVRLMDAREKLGQRTEERSALAELSASLNAPLELPPEDTLPSAALDADLELEQVVRELQAVTPSDVTGYDQRLAKSMNVRVERDDESDEDDHAKSEPRPATATKMLRLGTA